MAVGWDRPSWPRFLERAHELTRDALVRRRRPAAADHARAARALLARAGIAPGSATAVALAGGCGGGGCGDGRAAVPASYAALLRLLLVLPG